jgi:alcohol dehydrogenase (cytochrome c)
MMRPLFFRALIALALVMIALGSIANAADVAEQRLQNAAADSANWLHYGRDYTNQRFSPLNAVNTQTVKRLVPKWIYQTGYAATFQTSRLVADGIMYCRRRFQMSWPWTL